MSQTSDRSPAQPTKDASRSSDAIESPTADSDRRSTLGLFVVSFLNIGCILFVSYHFFNDGDEPGYSQPLSLRAGNISLEPASSIVLPIASAFDLSGTQGPTSAERPDTALTAAASEHSESTTLAMLTPPLSASTEPSIADPVQAPEDHWVQLGALSKTATAHGYWQKLRKNHIGLLGTFEPTIVGPDQLGGSLHHLRVGPFTARSAVDLCTALQEADTDCFCITNDGQRHHQWKDKKIKT